MPVDELKKYKNLYLQTAAQYVESIKTSSNSLTKDPKNTDAIKQLHIDSHSLKSQSLMMQYNNIGHFCEVVEKAMAQVIEANQEVPPQVLSLIQEGIGGVEKALKEIEANDTEVDLTEVTNKLNELTAK
jgi:chemotaxis protein histidine kinase CheA